MPYSTNKKVCFFLICLLTFSLCGCKEDDGSGYIFKYDITGNPRTLDPQTSRDMSAEIVIENIFEGLLKLDTDGNIVAGVAGEYEISEDMLKYTFYLRRDVFWYGKNDFKEQCTAHDFVFAFHRLFKPDTKSQNAEMYYCIQNGEVINKSYASDLNLIGVTAKDDFTLEIILAYPNPDFLRLLTLSPAMPCSKAFYNLTEGRYGLSAENTPSNGAFYVNKWNYDEYSDVDNNLVLRVNPNYKNENRMVYPYGLNFFIDEKDEIANFLDEDSHSVVSDGKNAEKLIESGYTYDSYENSVIGIIFNTDSVFGSEEIRKSLAMSLNRDEINVSAVGYRKTSGLIPDIITVGNSSYREVAKENFSYKYDKIRAESIFKAQAKKLGNDKLSGLTLIMEDNDVMKDYLGYINMRWQADLGFFFRLETMSESDLNEKISDGDFTIALVRLTASYNSPSALFDYFEGYENEEFNSLIKRAERADSSDESIEYYKKAEDKVLSSAVFIPLAYQTEYFFYQNGCKDIQYNPFTGTIYYKDAKIFK